MMFLSFQQKHVIENIDKDLYNVIMVMESQRMDSGS